MKKKWYLILSCITLCILAFLTGCQHDLKEVNKMDSTPTTAVVKAPEESNPVTAEVSVKAPEEPEPIAAEVTIAPIEPKEAIQGETIAQELSNDIDHNGIMDLVQILERADGSEYVQVFFNDTNIFQYEWDELRLIAIDAFEYLDLDKDGVNEIFITVSPNVNTRPLIEVLTLKQTDGAWYMLEVPLNELGNNCFPFSITRGKDEFDFLISSEYTDQQIHFDASSFYTDEPIANPNSIQAYRNNHYKEGDQVAYISSWGIWEAHTGTYDDYNCILAVQGIEAPYGNFLGRVFLYYDYNTDGSIEVLNIDYTL